MVSIFIFIVLILIFRKTPFGKGFIGEVLVNIAINFRLDKQKYHLFKNVTLPTKDGTTQVDHIIVSKYGVFVIETKNMKGWIFGDIHQKTWTQKIYKYTHKFQNPLHQNYKHIKTLESILNIDKNKFFSVITFVGDSTFKTKMPANVTHGWEFIKFIKSKHISLFSEKEIVNIILKIKNERLAQTFKTHQTHVKHVKSIIKEKAHQKICLKCNGTLVKRVAKRGVNKGNSFYGCSNYPKCKYTEQTI